jgi:hypothetical protein
MHCAAVLQFMEEVFSNQLAELEKDGLMVDGIHHRFTFFNKVYLFCILLLSINTASPPLSVGCRQTWHGPTS